MEKREFLDRLRSRLGSETHINLPHPLVAVDEIPSVGYPKSLDDPAEAFATAAEALGVQVHWISGEQSLREFLRRVVQKHGAETAVVSKDPETEPVPHHLEALGLRMLPFDGARSHAAADIGVTGAAWGVAATGSLVLNAARAGGRSASLLPGVHVALVREDRILPESGALFRQLTERFPEGLPSQLVLATGPSRSADIELELTVGVHGPEHVWVGILTQNFDT